MMIFIYEKEDLKEVGTFRIMYGENSKSCVDVWRVLTVWYDVRRNGVILRPEGSCVS